MKIKKKISLIIACMTLASSLSILSVSAISSSSQFGLNYWKDNGTTSTNTDSNGNKSYHKTFCQKNGSGDTNYIVNSEGHFYRTDGKDTWGYSRAIWYDGKGRTKVDSSRQWGYNYKDSYATVTSGWGIPSGYYAETYHGTEA